MIPKFKAFLKETEQIVDVETIHFELGVVKVNGIELYHFEDIILMQSTGLHDKNGVEIFDGYIVEHLDFNSNEISKSEVRILKGCFYLVISVDGFKYDVPMMDLKDDECILEIKGNVHENP